ncbi:MAG TPA: tRNA adenosine(34) deaminase TadA [Anaerolineaceae bacterium]|nr:tRNA adenosine(34) deaminase TadA [Anaerolineaceae bacterium]
MDDKKYMNMAINEAKEAFLENEVPIGCVIVHENTVIASTHNRKEQLNRATAHAEILAIEQACLVLGDWRLDDCILYVTLEPCPMCAGAIYQSRIKKVVFGAFDPKGGAYGSNFDINAIPRLNHYPSVSSGVLKDQCGELLKDFFKTKR